MVTAPGWNAKPEIVTDAVDGAPGVGNGVEETPGVGVTADTVTVGVIVCGIGVMVGLGAVQPETVITARANMANNNKLILMISLDLLYFYILITFQAS